MDKSIRKKFDLIYSENANAEEILKISDKKVDWAYEIWDELFEALHNKDNHTRAIAGQMISNLAKSDHEERILKDFNKLLEATKDERFVTARHILLSLWKIGVAGEKQRELFLKGMKKRFKECIDEKNSTLIRYDINCVMKNVYDETKSEEVKAKALELNEMEEDEKYKKKYEGVWRESH